MGESLLVQSSRGRSKLENSLLELDFTLAVDFITTDIIKMDVNHALLSKARELLARH
jgi:hypothetical protein